MKKIVYIDMDNVLVNFKSGIDLLTKEQLEAYKGSLDEVPGIFSKMIPVEGALDAFKKLSKHYNVFILSTAPWENPSAWSDKLIWVKKYLGEDAYKKLILSHNKHLNSGDYLIDDRTANGADKFKGEHIHFLSSKFPTWKEVLLYLIPK